MDGCVVNLSETFLFNSFLFLGFFFGSEETGNMGRGRGNDMQERPPTGLKLRTLWVCGMHYNH